jgi:hypothetical protein
VGDDEVSFKDMQRGTGWNKTGFLKLKLCCNQAAMDGLGYVWVDTCCIGKSSSAESTEAINSMYRWYQNATLCCAYLSDVRSKIVDKNCDFKYSEWFTRGWTLQELIAPAVVIFYNKEWHSLGTKKKKY